MRDKGLDRGLVQEFETSNRRTKGHFFGFRKMFWEYLNKLNVGFYDPCCPDAATKVAAFYSITNNTFEYIDPTTGDPVVIQADAASSYREITAATTITQADGTINATAGTFTQHLPASAVGNKGKIFVIKNSGSGTITVDVTGGQLIDGAATQTIAAGDSLTFQSTSTGYVLL